MNVTTCMDTLYMIVRTSSEHSHLLYNSFSLKQFFFSHSRERQLFPALATVGLITSNCLHAWCAIDPIQVYTNNKHTEYFHYYFYSSIIFRRNSKTQHNSNLTNMVIICNKKVILVISSAAKSLV